MRLPTEFPVLDTVRRRMGARLSSWTPPAMPERKPFQKEMPSGALTSVGPVVDGGPLAYQGQQVLLYIKDTRLDRQTLMEDPERSRRFHIAECRTLEGMRRDNRFARYVATNRTDGVFSVEATEEDTGNVESLEAPLYVCKNCLESLSLLSERGDWPKFSILDFFRQYETFFLSPPKHTDITAPRGGYRRDWSFIARDYKEKNDWKCEKCKVDLCENRNLLHCHHRNGDLSNNTWENLQALCVECHARQPGHGHYPPSNEERIGLNRLRTVQGIRA